jgi:hypothetical protein
MDSEWDRNARFMQQYYTAKDWNFNLLEGGMCKWHRKQIFFTAVIFTLEEAQCRRNASVCQYAIKYTTSDKD